MPESASIDPRLEALARTALAEVTRAQGVGALLDTETEVDGVATLHFACLDPGYPGWRWTASLSAVEGLEPTVLEVELLPGAGALLAPEWVPWADRLEEYRAHQAALAAEADELDGDDDLDDDPDDDVDEDELSDVDEFEDAHDGIDFESEPEGAEPAVDDAVVTAGPAGADPAEGSAAQSVDQDGQQQDEAAAEPAQNDRKPRRSRLPWRRSKN